MGRWCNMSKKVRWICVVNMAIVPMIGAFAVPSSTSSGNVPQNPQSNLGGKAVVGGVEWDFDVRDGTVTIKGVSNGAAGPLRIPSVINRRPVEHIGSYSFYRNNQLTDIVIPASVKTIGKKAFAQCINLRRVNTEGVLLRVASDAFEGCQSLAAVPRGQPADQTNRGQPADQPKEGSIQQTGKFGDMYMVIDLSGGIDAKHFPVNWLHSEPEGGWGDEYKTTKLVLRRIPAGSFMMGSPEDEYGHEWSEKRHVVNLTKPYYIGVFEVTQRQYMLVTGRPGSSRYQGDMRPIDSISWETVRGNGDWPNVKTVDDYSFMGMIRSKTGMIGFDLPTEAQWECACRAGTVTSLNNGKEITRETERDEMRTVGRCIYDRNGYATSGTSLVGSYKSNSWGLYDMHGNVKELCLDKWTSKMPKETVTDPVGGLSLNYDDDAGRVAKGGAYDSMAKYCRSASRCCVGAGYNPSGIGFRLCCIIEGLENSQSTSKSSPDKNPVNVSSLSLSISQPKTTKSPTDKRPQDSYYSYYSGDKYIASISSYSGSVRCKAKGGSATITVEAYFITRNLSDNSKEVIKEVRTVGNYIFDESNVNSQKFEFSSPEVIEASTRIREWNAGYKTRTQRRGEQYMGVIVRVLVDGRVEKVRSIPNNARWNAAGKKAVVTLD